MRFKAIADLPAKHLCRKCGQEKPLAEITVNHEKKTGHYLVRNCKACTNEKERGHRREWKREYLRRWRIDNAALSESYWRENYSTNRDKINRRAQQRFIEHHDAILIQGRLRRKGVKKSLDECKTLLKKFGPCYPTRFGLTPKGLRECERMRSSQRKLPKVARMTPLEIRMIAYEDGFFRKPKTQKPPYQHSARKLKRWHEEREKAA